MAIADDSIADLLTEYVTVTIGDHMFGLPIFRVQDVFVPVGLTRVPLAPPEVAGILNLRGRVVTAIDMTDPQAAWMVSAVCSLSAAMRLWRSNLAT